MVGPWTGRATEQYEVAGWLIGIGIVLWAITWAINRAIYARRTYLREPEELGGSGVPRS
jgi:APA family basic amino acid/polyamine antiporter